MSIDLKNNVAKSAIFQNTVEDLKPSLVKFCHQINLKNLIFLI